MKQILSELGLTPKQTKFLFSCQYILTMNDISHEKNKSKKKLKKEWLNKWKKSTEDYLSKKIRDDVDYKLVKYLSQLEKEVKKESETLKIKTPLYLILLETTFFIPYYPLGKSKEQKKKYKRIKIKKKPKIKKLYRIAKSLGIDKGLVDKFRNSHKKSLKGLTKFWQKLLFGGLIGAIVIAITAGFMAPVIGPLFAAQGLSGAAAISAGLAALGGGAIAAGGLGVAGGIAVIVGGGAILGAGTGIGVGALLKASPDFALTQAAKLEVVMKEITLNVQGDIRKAQDLIKEQRIALQKYEEELLELKKNREKNQEQIKNLSKSIDYLKKSIQRNEKIFEREVNK